MKRFMRVFTRKQRVNWHARIAEAPNPRSQTRGERGNPRTRPSSIPQPREDYAFPRCRFAYDPQFRNYPWCNFR